MEPENEEKVLNEKLQARFLQLPKALQNAITSADVEAKLRGLSETHKLHLDQWQKLENEVMLALLGFQPVENLEANIKNEVGITDGEASSLAGDIADTIFQPIRDELERELGKSETEEEKINQPEPEAEKPVASSLQPVARELDSVSPVHTSAQTIIESTPPRPVEVKATQPVPSTPPATPPAAKAVRATLSPEYSADTKSHERKTIDDDPYREAIS